MDVYDYMYGTDGEPTPDPTPPITYESLDSIKANLDLAQTYLGETIRGAINNEPQADLRRNLGCTRRLCEVIVELCRMALGDDDE